ncbi:hypothetical protein GCM10010174_60190 [Kutzneria viridogrisea]|uniref:Ribulose 1,5-bisphosphate carboxylase large subunit n=1 Tax=Kutzneria viridogrisea TaxID=47990 RepID=A0ABR6BJR5_9PSEU|nr:hypothetical protein [Kutzneria viridogrisea]
MALVLRVISPSALLELAKSTVQTAVDTAVVLVSVPARLLGVLGGAEALVERIGATIDRVDDLLARTERVVGAAEAAVTEVQAISKAAAGVIAETVAVCNQAAAVVAAAGHTSDRAGALVRTWEPITSEAAPLADRFVRELSADEVDAAIRLVDELPALTEHMTANVLPILATLDRVGPDVHELLNVTKDLRQAINGIPGFAFFKRRGEHREQQHED